jgi:hypothetical protein
VPHSQTPTTLLMLHCRTSTFHRVPSYHPGTHCIPRQFINPSPRNSLVPTTEMPVLLLPVLILVSTVELAFTAYMWYFITCFILSCLHAWIVIALRTIGGIEVITRSLFGMCVNTGILLGIIVVLVSTVALALGYRDSGGRGWSVWPLLFG